MQKLRLFAATGDGVARIDVSRNSRPEVHEDLTGMAVQCVAVDPADPNRIFAGTHDDGVFKSRDGGENWEPAGEDIPHKRTPSIAISPCHQESGLSVVYAGTEPSNIYRSDDDGKTWRDFPKLPELPSSDTWSFPPRPWTHHTRWITPHQHDPNVLFVGIELGGVMRSLDGGETWEDRKPGAYTDSHAIKVHPKDLDRVYEAAGQGVAVSTDRGTTWNPADDGMDRHYSWGLAVDPVDPDLWYVSASFGASYAHRSNGNAEAHLYRRSGNGAWELLDGKLDMPLPYMPYSLLTLQNRPNLLIVGMQHGEIMLSEDSGETWTTLDLKLSGLLQLSAAEGL